VQEGNTLGVGVFLLGGVWSIFIFFSCLYSNPRGYGGLLFVWLNLFIWGVFCYYFNCRGLIDRISSGYMKELQNRYNPKAREKNKRKTRTKNTCFPFSIRAPWQ